MKDKNNNKIKTDRKLLCVTFTDEFFKIILCIIEFEKCSQLFLVKYMYISFEIHINNEVQFSSLPNNSFAILEFFENFYLFLFA